MSVSLCIIFNAVNFSFQKTEFVHSNPVGSSAGTRPNGSMGAQGMKRVHKLLVSKGSQCQIGLLEDTDDAPTPLRCGGRCRDVSHRLTGRHFPSQIPAAPGSKRKHALRDCHACNLPVAERVGHKRKQSSYACVECNVTLCVPDCFKVYHTVKDYKTKLANIQE